MIEKNDPRLTAYVLGELEGSELKEIQHAIKQSEDLQHAVKEIQETTRFLSDQFSDEPKVALLEGQRETILNSHSAESESKSTVVKKPEIKQHDSFRPFLRFAIAAGLIGILMTLAYWMTFPPNPKTFHNAQGESQVEVQSSPDESREAGNPITEPMNREFYRAQPSSDPSQPGPVLPTTGPQQESLSNGESVDFYEEVDIAGDLDEGRSLAENAPGSNEQRFVFGGQTQTPNTNLYALQDGEQIEKSDPQGGDGRRDELASDWNRRLNRDGYGGRPQPALIDESESLMELNVAELDREQRRSSSKAIELRSTLNRGVNNEEIQRRLELLKESELSVSEAEVDKLKTLNKNSLDDIEAVKLEEDLEDRLELAEKEKVEQIMERMESGKQGLQLGELEQRILRSKTDEQREKLLVEKTRLFETEPMIADEGKRMISNLLKRVEPTGNREIKLRYEDQDGDGQKSIIVLSDGKELPVQWDSNWFKQQAEIEINEVEISEAQKQLTNYFLSRVDLRNTRLKLAKKKKSWKRVKATPNTSRLMIGDKEELDMRGIQVHVQVDGFRARILMDCFYYNDRGEQLEGNFKLRLPDDASLYYFAFGQSSFEYDPSGPLANRQFVQPNDGTQFVSLVASEIADERREMWDHVKEARMVPKEKAAFAYTQTVKRRVDPALVEWNGAGVFSARVFPLMPHKLHRIVIGYDVNLAKTESGWNYELQLPEQTGQCRIDLSVAETPETQFSIEPEVKPEMDDHFRFYSFDNKKLGQERSIRIVADSDRPALLQSSDEEQGSFWTTQITPELPEEKSTGSQRAVFLIDTSLSSSPDKFNVWMNMLRETLNQNRESTKHFAVLFFNVENYFWKEKYLRNNEKNVNKLVSDCEKLALEGATDLYAAIDKLGSTQWITDGGTPDLFLLSDGAATWGETDLRFIENCYASSKLGSLFAYQTGLNGTAINNLRVLADRSGGAVFSIANESEIKTAATAHRNRPWKIDSIEMDGGSDIMTAGRVSWVYPGQSITVVGRGEVAGNLQMKLERGDENRTDRFDFTSTIQSELAARTYGYVATGQLESLGALTEDVSAAYARHFRITGQTCSLLMLESEEDYQRFNIVPQEDLFVIKTRKANDIVQSILKKEADKLADPKSRFVSWIKKLESTPGVTFKIPTAMKLAMDEIEVAAVSKPVSCNIRNRAELEPKYLELLSQERLNYAAVVAESKDRGLGSPGDALKILSSLIEQNPGDLTLVRDIAFVALELDEPAQAYGLLRRVAIARPFEPTIYQALGKCLSELGRADMAMMLYEVAIEGRFQNRADDFRKIVSTEYMYLLRKVAEGKIPSKLKDYAKARLDSLAKKTKIGAQDILVTMMWNTDQSDIDLHVIEPSGEDCHYQYRRTKSGGQITRDITDGFGPEMYWIRNAPQGKYQMKVKYYGGNNNRVGMRSKVYMTIYRNYGRENESASFRTVELTNVGDLNDVATIGVEK